MLQLNVTLLEEEGIDQDQALPTLALAAALSRVQGEELGQEHFLWGLLSHHLEAARPGQQPEGDQGAFVKTINRHCKPKQTGLDDFKPFKKFKQKPPTL
jgi:hypothetical protein